MARPLRIEYPGALFHVIARGNEKKDIFLNIADRLLFLDLLSHAIKTYHWLCHAFCLMDNHYHLLIETPDANLSSGMGQLNGAYAQKFNKTHDRIGHLFQGRFKSFVVEKEPYLLELARYIVLNPIRKKLVEHPQDWTWSSYRATAGLGMVPDYLTISWMLSLFSNSWDEAQLKYQQFINAGMQNDSSDLLPNMGHALGTRMFKNKICMLIKNKKLIGEVSRHERMIGKPSLEEIFEEAANNKKKRDEAIICARFNSGYSNSEIARYLKLHYSTIGKITQKNSQFKI